MSFHFNVFRKKVWHAEPVPCTRYNQESQFLLFGCGTIATYSPSDTKYSSKYFNVYDLKSITIYLIQNCFYINAKKYK